MSKKRQPVGDVLDGMKIHPLDSGEKPEWAFILIKTASPDGQSWSFRTTAKPNMEELLGALEVQVGILRKKLVDQWDS